MLTRRYFLPAPLALLAGATGLVQAQQANAIKFIVPGSAGTGADTVARFMARALEKALAAPIVVDNKPGAGGVIGTDFVAKAPADGNTVLMTSANHYVVPWVYDKVPYSVTRDFAPVASYGSSALVVVVAPDAPFATLKDIVAKAKAEEGSVSFSSAGAGTLSHMCGALVNAMAGIHMRHVPYKSSPQGLLDVSSGAVTVGFLGVAGALPLIRAGKLKTIAVTSAKRSSHFPDVPSLHESGLAGFDITSPFLAFVPAGTPEPAIQRLSQALGEAAATPAFREFCAAQGLEPDSRSRAVFLQTMHKELEGWKKLVELTNAKGA